MVTEKEFQKAVTELGELAEELMGKYETALVQIAILEEKNRQLKEALEDCKRTIEDLERECRMFHSE